MSAPVPQPALIHWCGTALAADVRLRIGGKARALAQLGEAELPIPAWFAVLPEATAGEVLAAAARLAPAGELLAVRSSAVDEDGASHSFAGQLESFLDVPPGDVWGRVLDVRRSGDSERVAAYRREHGLALPPPVPAVLVQRMVHPDAAGVAFSADPVSGRRGVAVVAAVEGLGNKLVDGDADAETFQVNRAGEVIHREGAAQPVLSPDHASAVAALARRAERFFGLPQDIEWAIAGTELWLLQSRPITTLRDRPDPDGRAQLWDNSNIAESYGGITLPLTFSFARRAYEEVYRQFCRIMGVPDVVVQDRANLFRHMLGLVQGRVYYNLFNWYRVLALLPGFTVNRRFMEQMMGVKQALPDEVARELATTGQAARLVDAWRLAGTLLGLVRAYGRLERDVAAFYARLNEALGPSRPDLSLWRPDELASHYRTLEAQLLSRWNAPLVNDFFAMIFYGLLRQLSAKWCGDEDGTLQNDLLSGQGNMISAEPAARVLQMAEMARTDAALVPVLEGGTWREVQMALRGRPALAQAVDDYLARFGDRCMEELKLESATLHDDPLPLVRSVASLARHPQRQGGPVTEALSARAEARVRAALRGRPLRAAVYRWVLRNARRLVTNRENLRFERTRVFGRVRMIFVELGWRFHALGKLAEARDVFYLEVEEALGFVEGTATCGDLAGLVAVRKAEYERHRAAAPPPDRFETRGVVQHAQARDAGPGAAQEEGDTRRGLGACPGVVRGRVRVVRDPKGATLQQGEILVAERTDPGWIMLFPLAAGLLVERGSLLSHSAIVAREMGLPTIVSLSGVTTWLRDGDEVEMDGSTGQVRKEAGVDQPSHASPQ